MSELTSLAISVALLGGVCTWFTLSVGVLLIWAAFAAWACFFHSGGDVRALCTTLVSNCFGVFIAWLTAVVIVTVPGVNVLGAAVWPSVVVCVSIACYISAARVGLFSSIPAVTYGYACTFAFLLQTPGKFSSESLMSLGFSNALIIVPSSMIVGALFAFASAHLAARLQRRPVMAG
jgi:hypothetical protein